MAVTTKDYLCDCHGVSVYGPPHHLTPAMSSTEIDPERETWAINARWLHTTRDGYTGSTGAPTFYVDPNVQGAMTAAAAERVALEILHLGVSSRPVNDRFVVTVVAVDRVPVWVKSEVTQ